MSRKIKNAFCKTGLCAVLLIWAFFLVPGTVMAEEAEHDLQFFFENVCASCHEEDDFYELFNRVISKEEKQMISYEIRTYNVFQDANLKVYEDALAAAGKTKEEAPIPVLLIDGQWISGYETIEAQLHQVLVEGKPVDQSEEGAVSVEVSQEMSQEMPADAAKSLLDLDVWEGISQESPAFLLFTTYSCDGCKAAKACVEELEQENSFTFAELNVSEGENLELFKQFLKISGRSDKEGKVPAVFIGGKMLVGKEEIQEKLHQLLREDSAAFSVLKKSIEQLEGKAEVQKISIPVMFGAGLLAGFNPCAVSMLLMLFSILLTGRASVLKNGVLYLAGKYVTYFAIGVLFCVAAAGIDQKLLDRFGTVTSAVLAMLFLAVAVLNFMDFRNVRKEQYGKVRMQLPAKLRRFNHVLLKHAEHMEGLVLSLVVLGLGVAISVGEFFCTGQIYMASLLYLIRNGELQMLQLIGILMVYVTAMSIPAAVILILIHKTKKVERISEFMLEHMSSIKLLNGILFLAYAVYFIADCIG